MGAASWHVLHTLCLLFDLTHLRHCERVLFFYDAFSCERCCVIRLLSMISPFRFVVSFAFLQTCARGELGKFVSGGMQSLE